MHVLAIQIDGDDDGRKQLQASRANPSLIATSTMTPSAVQAPLVLLLNLDRMTDSCACLHCLDCLRWSSSQSAVGVSCQELMVLAKSGLKLDEAFHLSYCAGASSAS